ERSAEGALDGGAQEPAGGGVGALVPGVVGDARAGGAERPLGDARLRAPVVARGKGEGARCADGGMTLVAVLDEEVVGELRRRDTEVRAPPLTFIVVAVIALEEERGERVLGVGEPPVLDRRDLGM